MEVGLTCAVSEHVGFSLVGACHSASCFWLRFFFLGTSLEASSYPAHLDHIESDTPSSPSSSSALVTLPDSSSTL